MLSKNHTKKFQAKFKSFTNKHLYTSTIILHIYYLKIVKFLLLIKGDEAKIFLLKYFSSLTL